jgi:hypothetical protein
LRRSPTSWLIPALLWALAAARAGVSAETTETDKLRLRVYDRSGGVLAAEMSAAKARYSGGVFELREVRITSRGDGSLREARSGLGSYDVGRGVAELFGGVELAYRPEASPTESAKAELAALTWDSRRGEFRSSSPVKAAYTCGGRPVAELDAVGISGSAAENSLVFAKLGRLVIHDRARMVGRLDESASAAEEGASGASARTGSATVTCKGPVGISCPERTRRSVELSFVDEVLLVEPEGSMACDSLVMTLARSGAAVLNAASGAYYLEHAAAVGPRFRSGGDSAEAAWAEYGGDFDMLLLAGAKGAQAVLRRAGQGELAAPRILIDRRARSVATGGEGDTRLSIRRPGKRPPEESEPAPGGGGG